jgi:hypothetical protein
LNPPTVGANAIVDVRIVLVVILLVVTPPPPPIIDETVSELIEAVVAKRELAYNVLNVLIEAPPVDPGGGYGILLIVSTPMIFRALSVDMFT